jgi:hypothetical protein
MVLGHVLVLRHFREQAPGGETFTVITLINLHNFSSTTMLWDENNWLNLRIFAFSLTIIWQVTFSFIIEKNTCHYIVKFIPYVIWVAKVAQPIISRYIVPPSCLYWQSVTTTSVYLENTYRYIYLFSPLTVKVRCTRLWTSENML